MKERDVINLAVRSAGDLIRDMHPGKPCPKQHPLDLVSEADYAAQRVILDVLQLAFPADQVISEEMISDIDMSLGRVWIIDPLDGSVNYLRRNPLWSVGACLMIDGQVACSSIYTPMLNEHIWADTSGCYRDGTQLKIEGGS